MTSPEVETIAAGPRVLTRRVVVSAPVDELFALVADPHRHPELDGSGTVRDNVRGPHVLSAGATFTVGMKQYGFPYWIRSTVTEFSVDRVVEWQHPVGHRWRWEFEALGPDSTQVTETWDYTHARLARLFELIGQPGKNDVGITKTLEGLAARYS